jgi:hypothetical protein
MYLLKKARPFIILLGLLASCTPRAALTPQAAFYDLKTAFQASNADMLARQLSKGSLEKINRMTALFSQMDDRQLESLSKKFGVPAEKLKNLGVQGYCVLALGMNRDRNVIGIATRYAIVGVDREGKKAVIRVENGMELTFVKEGPYWKFDMSNL